MKNIVLSCFLFMGILLTSCGDVAKYSKIAEELNNSQIHNNKQIDVVGTVEVPTGVFAMDGKEKQKVMMSVSAGGEKIYNIELNYGKDAKNAIYIDVPEGQEEFEAKDMKLYDNNGNVINRGGVRMKGTVKYGLDDDPEKYVIQDVILETTN